MANKPQDYKKKQTKKAEKDINDVTIEDIEGKAVFELDTTIQSPLYIKIGDNMYELPGDVPVWFGNKIDELNVEETDETKRGTLLMEYFTENILPAGLEEDYEKNSKYGQIPKIFQAWAKHTGLN